MKVNRKYLNEFCREFNVLQTGTLTIKNKLKISYNFGTPLESLEDINSKIELEEKINTYSISPSEAEEDLEVEVRNFYKSF